MCFKRVYVRDLLHNGLINSFNCGHCKACLQAKANKRAQKISNHVQPGSTCFFLTLTYDNRFVPYIKRSEILRTRDYDHMFVYRDYNVRFVKGKKKSIRKSVYKEIKPLETRHYVEKILSEDFELLKTLRTKLPDGSFRYDPDRVSVVYTRDFSLFINRFRQNLFRRLGERVPISYYFAPEYGPTTSRFHMHVLLWIPDYCQTYSQLVNLIKKSWPYCKWTPYTTKEHIQIVNRDDAYNYVASYVNCDASVSPWLRKWFPLRPSHSLFFGYNQDYLSDRSIINSYRQGKFGYDVQNVKSDGTIEQLHILYPNYVLDKLFPSFKGCNSIPSSRLLQIYANPDFYFPVKRDFGCLVYSISCKKFKLNTDRYYFTSIKDRFGRSVYLTAHLASYYRNKIKRAIERLSVFTDNPAKLIVDYINARRSYLIKHSFDNYSASNSYQNYTNIQSFYRKMPPTLFPYTRDLPYKSLQFESFPQEVGLNCRLLDRYNDKIKQRKLNCL